MNASTMRTAAACALLATTALATPALAQTPTSPTFRNIDANGVDLTHGDLVFAFPEGSIGSGDAEIALIRTGFGSADPSAKGSHQWDGIRLHRNGNGVYIDFGSRTEKFPEAQARRSSLTGAGDLYEYRSTDGTIIMFGDPSGGSADIRNVCDASGTQASCVLMPLTIQSPDRKVVTLDWDIWTRCNRQVVMDDPITCDDYPRLAQVANSFGYAVAFAYTTGGTSGRVAPPVSWYQRTSATFHNNAVGTQPISSLSYAHPAAGVVVVTDPAGRVWRLTNSSTGIAIRRPGAAVDTTVISKGGGGTVMSVLTDGVTTDYARAISGSTATMTVTDALGGRTVVTSDLNIGRAVSVVDPLDRTTRFQHDASGRLTHATAPGGYVTRYRFDARGNVTETRSAGKPGSGVADIVTSARYEADCGNPVTCNLPLSTTDAGDAVSDYAYDPVHGGVLSVTLAPAPDGVRPQTRYGYALVNGEYRLTSTSTCQTGASCAGTAHEVKADIGYDASGNITSTATGAGDGSLTATQAMRYDAQGNLLTVDGPLAGPADTTRLRYTAARELVGSISPDPNGTGPLKHRATRTTIDVRGLVTRTETGTVTEQSDAGIDAMIPLEAVGYGYDAHGRKVRESMEAGGSAHAVSEIGYDAKGRPECVVQRMNPQAFGASPGACALGQEGAFGPDRIVRTHYDALDRPRARIEAVGTADEAAVANLTYLYDGMVETVADALGNRTRYAYDAHGRLSRTHYPVATGTPGASNDGDYEELRYDAASNVIRRRLRDEQEISYAYDAFGRVTAKDLPGAEPDVSYRYDLLGRMKAASQPGHELRLAYDALGRKVSETGPFGTVASRYDVAGRRNRLTYTDRFVVAYDYLDTGEMKTIRDEGATSGQGVLATFDYDLLGRRKTLTRGNGTVTSYSYDTASRLESLGQELNGTAGDLALSFGYNPASQIMSNMRNNDAYSWAKRDIGTMAATMNGLNQPMLVAGATLTHDARGNVTSDGVNGFAFSSENLLTSIAVPGKALTMMRYDPLGRVVFHGTAASPQSTGWGFDGTELVAEYDGAGAINRRYVHGPGVDEPLVLYAMGLGGPGTVTRAWLHADERGSITAHSLDNGNSVGPIAYDEYGATSTGSRFGYTGQAMLPANSYDFYWYKARVYHTKLGRFLQTDPIGYEDGMNLYGYVGGDPVNFTDPSGLRRYCVQGTNSNGSWSRLICGDTSGFSGGGFGGSSGGRGRFTPRMLADDNGGGGSGAGAAPTAAGSSLEEVNRSKYVTDLKCNQVQGFVRIQGQLTSSVSGAITAGGLTAGTAFAAIGLGEAVTGNPAAALVGAVRATTSAAVTAFGGLVSLVGAAEQLAGGSSTRLIFRQATNAVVVRLPLPSLLKGYAKEALKQAERYVPDLRICR